MRWLRVLIGVGIASVCFPVNAVAMGSGPHPNVPYGIPVSTAHGAPAPGSNGIAPPTLPIWVIPSLVLAAMVIWSVPPGKKK